MLDDEVLHVTISVGATMAAPGEDYADVLRRGARLVQAAKAAGGNQTATDAPSGSPVDA